MDHDYMDHSSPWTPLKDSLDPVSRLRLLSPLSSLREQPDKAALALAGFSPVSRNYADV
jgi:hypothetical protein